VGLTNENFDLISKRNKIAITFKAKKGGTNLEKALPTGSQQPVFAQHHPGDGAVEIYLFQGGKA
jgi:hypothetical protein